MSETIKDALNQIELVYENMPVEHRERIMKGIQYCEKCDWRVMASAIPDEILGWWTENDGNTIFVLGCTFYLVQINKCMVPNGYAEQGGETEFNTPPSAIKLLRYVRAAREEGKSFPDFDVFDVREYGRMLKEFEK